MKVMPAVLFFALTLSFFPDRGGFSMLQELVDTALLSSGQIQYIDYKDAHGVSYRTGAVLIDASPEMVWGVMEDLEKLGSSLKHIEYYRIRHEAAGDALWKKGEILVEGRFAVDEFPAQFTLRMESDRDGRWRKWRILTSEEMASYHKKGIKILPSGGLIKAMSGFEYLGPFEGGTKTVYYFAMNIESSIPMPEYLLRSVNDTVYTGQTACIRQAAESFNPAPIRTGTLPLQKDP